MNIATTPPAPFTMADLEDDDFDTGDTFKTVRLLLAEHTELREPIIHGLLRRGETMNIIAPPKTGKSWLVTDLAIAVTTGRSWLGQFQVERGDVLILDNELHSETIANRIPRVARARGVMIDEFEDRLCVESLRGNLVDIFAMGDKFRKIRKGRFKLVIIDALYRVMPEGFTENDNGMMARVYNAVDQYADQLGCAFVLIHHSSKGGQSGKGITDVGAGAGSQSRAADSHVVIRDHEEPGVIVLDAAVRSWPPFEPRCFRREFPIWQPAEGIDATKLKVEGKKKKPEEESWTAEVFAQKFVRPEPQVEAEILNAADEAKLSERKAKRLLKAAVAKHLAFRIDPANKRLPHKFTSTDPGEQAKAA